MPRRPHRRAARPCAAVAVLLSALSACQPAGGPGGDARAQEAPANAGVRERERTKVVVGPLERREMVELLETTAVLEAERQVPVVARRSGQVVEVLAEEGDTVQKGQVLAVLDARSEEMALRSAQIALEEARGALAASEIAIDEARTAIETAQSQLAQAERDLARDEELSSTSGGGVSAVSAKALEQSRLARDQAAQELEQRKLALQRAILDRDTARTSVSRAEVTRDEAALALERMGVEAPFDGVVASRTLRLGQNLAAGEEAFVVADPLDLRVVFYRPQRELAGFAGRGEDELAVTARAEALPGVEFAGRVARVAPVVDAESGSFRVTATMDRVPVNDGPQRLLPGMLLRLSIVTDRRPDALVARKRAVVREGDQAFLFVVEEGPDGPVARRRAVREGFDDADHVEVAALEGEPLDEGVRVVVIGARDLADGDLLEVESEGAGR